MSQHRSREVNQELLSKFDLILTMVRIADTDVSAFGRQVKQKYPELPVVLLVLSEADLTLQYLASPGNDATNATSDAYASTGIDQVVYDGKDRPILCLHWSESYRQFRGMDPGLQHERWMIPGCAPTYGAASDGHGRLYSLREADKDTVVLRRIDEETGKIDEVEGSVDAIKIDRLRSTRGIAGKSQPFLPHEGVDQAGLPHVASS